MMVCGIHKLTQKGCFKFIRTCAGEGRRAVLNDGGGLYLCVGVTGAASWIFRYERDGKRHEMGLGALHTFSLDEARERARVARQQLHKGDDPLTEKRRAKAAETIARPASKPFHYCTREFLKSREANWRSDKHRKEWESSVTRYVYPVIGDILVSDITTEHVLKVLQPQWEAKTETMMRVRGRIEMILDWAIAKKFRSAPNPALWKANLDALLDKNGRKATEHLAAIAYEELPSLVSELQQDPRIAAKALLFTTFTCLRTKETLGLQWTYIDFASQSMTIPAEQMKMERPHRVPLTAPALAILEKLAAVRTASPYVFTSGTRGKPLPERAMRDTLRRLRPEVAATVHGSVRAGFATWRAEETSHDVEVAEACLAHAKKDKVLEAYSRGSFYKKRCDLMTAWGRYLSSPVGGNVTPLRQIS
jgi:integrase